MRKYTKKNIIYLADGPLGRHGGRAFMRSGICAGRPLGMQMFRWVCIHVLVCVGVQLVIQAGGCACWCLGICAGIHVGGHWRAGIQAFMQAGSWACIRAGVLVFGHSGRCSGGQSSSRAGGWLDGRAGRRVGEQSFRCLLAVAGGRVVPDPKFG